MLYVLNSVFCVSTTVNLLLTTLFESILHFCGFFFTHGLVIWKILVMLFFKMVHFILQSQKIIFNITTNIIRKFSKCWKLSNSQWWITVCSKFEFLLGSLILLLATNTISYFPWSARLTLKNYVCKIYKSNNLSVNGFKLKSVSWKKYLIQIATKTITEVFFLKATTTLLYAEQKCPLST